MSVHKVHPSRAALELVNMANSVIFIIVVTTCLLNVDVSEVLSLGDLRQGGNKSEAEEGAY